MAAGVLATSVNYSSSQSSAAPLSRSQIGGYDADFVSPISADYLCPICQLAFRDPVQTRDCGHRFCESCLEPILRKPPAFCPIDRRTLTREKQCLQAVGVSWVIPLGIFTKLLSICLCCGTNSSHCQRHY